MVWKRQVEASHNGRTISYSENFEGQLGLRVRCALVRRGVVAMQTLPFLSHLGNLFCVERSVSYHLMSSSSFFCCKEGRLTLW